MKLEQKSVCDEKTFRIIFDTYIEIIRNFIFYKCGDMDRAEDIAQDAFVKLWNNCKKVLYGKAKSFLLKVAQNTFFNEQNHKKVILKYSQAVTSNDRSDIYDPDFLLQEKEFKQKLQKSIAALSDKNREVFLLSRMDKKTYREIAEIVGITQKAVERRMHLALVELKERLGKSL